MGTIVAIIIVSIGIAYITSHWSNMSFQNVQFKRYVDKERIFVGEKVRLTTEITNRKLLPLPWIEIHTEIPESFIFQDQKVINFNRKSSKKIYKVITSLISYQKVKRHNNIYCDKRGYYDLYDVKASIGDYLGMKVAERDLVCPMRLIVYPQIKPLERLIVTNKEPQGNISVRRWIMPDPMDIIGAREYTTRDSFNSIDWKTTSKIGKLHVKKLDFTANPSIMTFLDVQTGKIHWQDVDLSLIESGIDIAASITHKALEEKIPIGYTSNAYFNGDKHDLFIKPRMGKSQKSAVLEGLAKTTDTRRISIEELIGSKMKNLNKDCIIVLITSHLSNNLKNLVNVMSTKGYNFKIILLSDSKDVINLNKNVELFYQAGKTHLAI